MPVISADKGIARKYSDEDIADMQRMSKTMSHREIGEVFGVSGEVIARQLSEYGTADGKPYKPRVLRAWPQATTFHDQNYVVAD
jgi:hypothetical protein